MTVYTAVATDGVHTDTCGSTNLRRLIERCLEAEEVYGCEVWIETPDGVVIWDDDPITREKFALVLGA